MESKSTRALRDAVTAGGDCEAPQSFNDQFDILDKDGNGTLDRNEAYQLAQLWKTQRDTNTQLKTQMGWIVGGSLLIISILAAATFGATFVAVAANKETSVASSGALMSKDGSRELSTVSHGKRFHFEKTSDTPLCITKEDFDAIQLDTLDGANVVLDIEASEGGHHVVSLDANEMDVTDDFMCFPASANRERAFCFLKADCLSPAQRRLQEERGLRVSTSYIAADQPNPAPHYCYQQSHANFGKFVSSCSSECGYTGNNCGWWPYSCTTSDKCGEARSHYFAN